MGMSDVSGARSGEEFQVEAGRDVHLGGGPRATLSVGDVARRSGVSVSTLHFYERQGLLRSERTAGNQRRFKREVLRRIAFIRTAQRIGIPLADIRAALDTLPDARTPTRRDWARLSEAWRADLDDRIRQLEHLRNDLTECIGCGCLSLGVCKLQNPHDELGRRGPGPRYWVDEQ